MLSIHFYTFLYTYLSLYNTVMSIYTILSSTVCRTQSSTPSLHCVDRSQGPASFTQVCCMDEAFVIRPSESDEAMI